MDIPVPRRERLPKQRGLVIERTLQELEAENAYLNRMLKEVQWARMRDRFHAFDGIQDDSCPACGGRVEVEETPNAVRLKAVR